MGFIPSAIYDAAFGRNSIFIVEAINSIKQKDIGQIQSEIVDAFDKLKKLSLI